MTFLGWLVMMVMWLGGIAFGCIAAATMVTYCLRTWQLIRADEDGSHLERVLDGVDRVQTQLDAMSERLGRLEERALPPPSDDQGHG